MPPGHVHVTTTTIKMQNHSITWRIPELHPSCHTPPPYFPSSHLQPLATPKLSSHFVVLRTLCVTFQGQFSSLSRRPLRSVLTACPHSQLLFAPGQWSTAQCTRVCLATHPLHGIWISGFWLLKLLRTPCTGFCANRSSRFPGINAQECNCWLLR